MISGHPIVNPDAAKQAGYGDNGKSEAHRQQVASDPISVIVAADLNS
ncbi:hypothetical protein SAMN04488059_1575 [Devosia psychrophila]|uniref:Uncharacterized protein n=1 Tax=Devosia psychrophila TaxID=728005 RepID=A0A1I1S7E6_9HYPH|nr:hypothetical protein SAMN04488059_1575 [Devosia psychrophila]